MFATSVTRPPHELLGLAHILSAVPIDGLADFFRCKEAAQLHRVAADFAFNSLLKDKVSPEARQWEKRRDEQELTKQIERILKIIAEVEWKSGESPWLKITAISVRRIYTWSNLQEAIKDKPIDWAEAYLKEQMKSLEHIVLRCTPPP